jgi:Holliday junction resolvase RusA-like endonuclease
MSPKKPKRSKKPSSYLPHVTLNLPKGTRVVLSVFLGAGARGDADNFGKCALDALVSAGVIHSDAAIESLTINKFRDRENPRTEITVEAM